jgi:hypothetical protein
MPKMALAHAQSGISAAKLRAELERQLHVTYPLAVNVQVIKSVVPGMHAARHSRRGAAPEAVNRLEGVNADT